MKKLSFEKDGYSYSLEIFAEYDYNLNRSRCECDSICRCGTIENVSFIENSVLVHIDVRKIRGSIVANPKKIDKSITNQIVGEIIYHINQNPSNYIGYSVVSGYYGEELIVDYDYHAIKTILDDLVSKYTSTTHKPKSHYEIIELLRVEYGYIIPLILNTKNVIRINMTSDMFVKDVVNSDKFLVSKEPVVTFDYDYDTNVAGILYRMKDGRYFLIDGHHRTFNLLAKGIDSFSYYLLYD